ncbi:hypothetical protein ACFVZD_36790 [Streptomyces sp. NPDC058287]|uniref:hypothetical protein n=1 Tax=Streptomyces sp. NPDC058287 TaxID=3346423 RepID=UPI0036EE2372
MFDTRAMPEEGLDAAARSLRAWLNSQKFSDLSAPEVTAFLTDSISRWAEGLDYIPTREVDLPANKHKPQQRRQILDLQLKHYSGKGRQISIEIDRGNKRISLNKLVHAAELGHLALWVRWGYEHVPFPMPPTVRLIRAHVIRRRVARQPDRYSLQVGNCG